MGNRPTNVRYIVLFGLCLAAGLAYVHRGCLSVVESTVRGDLGITPRDMGWALGGFFWAYALFQIPTGLLVDRWGPRKSLCLFGVLGAITMAMSAGTLWADAATGFIILLAARLLMGIAQAGLFPASTRAMSTWIPMRRRAFAAGFLQSCMSLGGAAGAFFTAQLLGVVSWPWVFVVYAIPGLLWSAWFFAWFRDRPEEHCGLNAEERALLRPEAPPAPAAPEPTAWSALFEDPAILLLCAQQFFRAGAAVFWFTWCPTYLQNVHGLSPKVAGTLTSLPIIGFMLGSMVGGVFADRVYVATKSRRRSRCGTAIGATFLAVIFFAATYAIPPGLAGLAVLSLVVAGSLAGGGNSCSYSTAMDLGGRNLATVFGAMNMCGNFGAALFSQVAPEWVRWFGWEALVLLVGGSYLAGMLLWIPLNPDRPPKLTPEELDYDESIGR
jgi:ACS family glucarate transporter-like MFS transporter